MIDRLKLNLETIYDVVLLRDVKVPVLISLFGRLRCVAYLFFIHATGTWRINVYDCAILNGYWQAF